MKATTPPTWRGICDSYLTHREEWAILDHDKPGLARAATARSAAFAPAFRGTAADAIARRHAAARPPTPSARPPRVELAFAPARGRPRPHPPPPRQAGQPDARGELPLLPPRRRDRLALPQDRPLAPGGPRRPARRRPPPGGLRRRRHAPGGGAFEIVAARHRRSSRPEGGDFMAFAPDAAGLRAGASASTSTTTSGAPTSRCGGRAPSPPASFSRLEPPDAAGR